MVIRALLLILLTFPAASLGAGGDSPVPPPAKGDRCGVCGMYVAPFPTWVAALRFKDGKVEYFDGPKDMFKRLFTLPPDGDKPAVYVTDYYSARLIPVENVRFVVGSDVLGPMGRELIPLASEKEAAGFRHDHGGKETLSFGEVTRETIGALE